MSTELPGQMTIEHGLSPRRWNAGGRCLAQQPYWVTDADDLVGWVGYLGPVEVVGGRVDGHGDVAVDEGRGGECPGDESARVWLAGVVYRPGDQLHGGTSG